MLHKVCLQVFQQKRHRVIVTHPFAIHESIIMGFDFYFIWQYAIITWISMSPSSPHLVKTKHQESNEETKGQHAQNDPS